MPSDATALQEGNLALRSGRADQAIRHYALALADADQPTAPGSSPSAAPGSSIQPAAPGSSSPSAASGSIGHQLAQNLLLARKRYRRQRQASIQAGGKLQVVVTCWSLSENPAGRAYTLASLSDALAMGLSIFAEPTPGLPDLQGQGAFIPVSREPPAAAMILCSPSRQRVAARLINERIRTNTCVSTNARARATRNSGRFQLLIRATALALGPEAQSINAIVRRSLATGTAAPGDVSNAGAGTQPHQRPDRASGTGRPQGVPGCHQAVALREFWRRGSTGRDSRAQWRHPESRRGGASPAPPVRVSTHDQASL